MIACYALLLLAGGGGAPPVSAPIANIQYEVTFTRETAARRTIHIGMEFDVTGAGDVLLSLPIWTPGAYEVSNFARWVSSFSPTAAGQPLRWDKLDYDTWRIRPAGARHLSIAFDYLADSLDNAMAWSRPDFAFFNGTNVFLYPEGRSLLFPATVRVRTEADWLVATSMHRDPATGTYGERNYHDLVDMPFFIGRFDYDSAQVGGVNARLASYPAGQLAGAPRAAFWEQYRKLFAPEAAAFGDMPFTAYTTLMVFDSAFGGGSALEHQSSHLAVYTPAGIGQPWLTSVTAHEMIHAWNVKRLRPAEMVPYRYDAPDPTPWLWVSEGITDYYADLVLLRSGVVDSNAFLETTTGKIQTVDNTVPVALEDASLSTWIHPTDGSGYVYYPKGSLAGFMLDILIRDASDDRHSLDDVMRELYRTVYQAGKGFTGRDWWGAVRRAAGGRDFTTFKDRYVDGREPFPWDSVLPLAGLRLRLDSTRVARLGIESRDDSTGAHVTNVLPGGVADQAGVQVGDQLLALGDVTITGFNSFEQFRGRYANQDGADLPIHVRRGGQDLTLPGKVRLVLITTPRIVLDPGASAKAQRIRHGLFAGTE
jgi:predicted metalloprotease with PDZ domain